MGLFPYISTPSGSMILRACRTVSLQTTKPWSVTNRCQTDLYPTSLPLPRSSCSIAVNTVLTSEELCRLLRPLRARILFSCRKLSSRSCSRRIHSNISAWLYPSLKYCSMSSSRTPRHLFTHPSLLVTFSDR